MNSKLKILKMLGTATILTSTVVFAQDAQVNLNASINGMSPPEGLSAPGEPHQGGPNFFQKMFKEIRGENRDNRQEIRNEVRSEFNQAKKDLKEGIEMRKDWRNGSGTQDMATPTPWKDFKGEMRDIRTDFKGDIKQMRDDMRGKIASLTESQIAEISVKTGLTIEAIKVALATGTPLFAIVKDKISPEDMMKFLQRPIMGSTSMASRTERQEERQERRSGFFNDLRLKLFGGNEPKTEVIKTVNADGSVTETTVVVEASTTSPESLNGIRNFFKRFFNF